MDIKHLLTDFENIKTISSWYKAHHEVPYKDIQKDMDIIEYIAETAINYIKFNRGKYD